MALRATVTAAALVRRTVGPRVFTPVGSGSRPGLTGRWHRPFAVRSMAAGTAGGSSPKNYVDIEREFTTMQREVRELVAAHRFEEAMGIALELRDQTKQHYGAEHPVVASSMNNVALLEKSMGNFETSIEMFIETVQVSASSVGKEHASTATALHTLGLAYKAAADVRKGIDQLTLLERAKEAFEASLDSRKGSLHHRSRRDADVAVTTYTLGGVLRMMNQAEQALELLKTAVSDLREVVATQPKATRNVLLLATALNNLAFHLKSTGEHDAAHAHYEESLTTREKLLGPSHPETIAVKHNLAELLMAMGKNDEADAVQREILDVLGGP